MIGRDAATAALCETAHAVASRGMVVGSGGNLSVRTGDDLVITARGAQLASLDAAGCVTVAVADAAPPVEGRPSSELPLHRRIYEEHGVGAIVHTHSTYAVVMSALVDAESAVLPAVHYASALLGGEVRVAPYAQFGSEELGRLTSEGLTGRRAVLMRNHGAVAVGETLDEALAVAVNLEWLAQLAYLAAAAGGGTTIDAEELERVAERSRTWNEVAR